MAHNIQDDADDNPDLSEVLERSRNNWLDGQDVHQIFSLHNDPNPSLDPVDPFEEGLFLFHRWSEVDTNDWLPYDHGRDIQFKKTRENPNPMRYNVARLFLDPIAEGNISTYERRIYLPRPMYREFRLVHYRIRHIVNGEPEEESGDDTENSGDDSGDDDPGHDGGGNDGVDTEEGGTNGVVNDEDAGVGDDHADAEDPPASPSCNGHFTPRGTEGKIPGSHVSSRVLQTCVKYCSQAEKEGVLTEFQPHFLNLASYTYDVHLLNMLDGASKQQLTACVSSLRGHVTHLLLHMASAEFVMQQLTGPLLIRMVHTRDGSIVAIKHGSAKNGRRPLLQLLHPNSSRYFSRDDLASLDLSIPSLMNKSETSSQTKDSDSKESGEEAKDEQEEIDLEENVTAAGGKKDPLLRRQELLVNSGLAEVAMGASDGILCPSLSEKLSELYKAITSVAAKHKPQEPEKKNSEHILENFHSSRTIRRLVLDCPAFASTLFKNALSGNCRSWAQGHCAKILSAFLETRDLQVREMAEKELQVLVNEGALKISETKKPE